MESEWQTFRANTVKELLSRRNSSGTWEGKLSSSALSTAVSIFALSQLDTELYREKIEKGLDWLADNINEDGGYGDTPESPSNISTTLLCWAAFTIRTDSVVEKVEAWLKKEAGSLDPDVIVDKILNVYGDDHTFSVPILTTLAISGRLGVSPWRKVLQLPFELSIFPSFLFKILKLEVVSYALPALITIGMVRFRNHRSMINPLSWFRKFAEKGALKKLMAIQPENGGFLEASPLTGFVLMSLCNSGLKKHETALKCAEFLVQSFREDGSIPIDTHLHTWVTTLSINALTENQDYLNENEKLTLLTFLTDQQYKEKHPYTNAAPGGWAWSPLPGAVPDADDTSGALVALRRLAGHKLPVKEAEAGIAWLLGLQNKDGGIPTFCRGWGKLPFDQSCPDITAHCIRAFIEWRDDVKAELQDQIDKSVKASVKYLINTQRADGSWNPLWFGNQRSAEKLNLTYGTAQVVIALSEGGKEKFPELIMSGRTWLESAQNEDGSWGGIEEVEGSIEETALAVNALISSDGDSDKVKKGIKSLSAQTKEGTEFSASPIGLYFASLWYDEEMYPLVYTAAALEKYFK